MTARRTSAENFRPINRISRFVGSMNVRWRPLTWLDAEGTFGYDSRQNFQSAQQDRGYRTNTPAPAVNEGNISRSAGRGNSSNASLNVTARKSWFDENLNTRLTLRYLYEEQTDISQSSAGQQLAVPGLQDPNAAISNFDIGGGSSAVRQLGMFVEPRRGLQGPLHPRRARAPRCGVALRRVEAVADVRPRLRWPGA